jgi:hypothetical protein
MKIRRIIGLLLAGLLLTGCGTDDEADRYVNLITPTGTPTAITNVYYEGIWSIDEASEEKSDTIFFNQFSVIFPTFPYQAVLNSLMPELKDCRAVKPKLPPVITLTIVGNTGANNYYNMDQYQMTFDGRYEGTNEKRITFDAITPSGDTLTIKLDLLYDQSVFSFNNTAASCILVVKQVFVTDAVGEQRVVVMNPERKLTFVSIKRV